MKCERKCKNMVLNEPIRICKSIVKNRIVVPAMSDFGTDAPDGLVHQSHINRYEAYAKGGAGLIIVEACSVLGMSENRDTICLESDNSISGLKCLTDVIHQYSAVTLVQIMLTGLSTMKENHIEEISRKDFLRYKDAFVCAAKRCQAAGFDGIELHAAHGMYLDEVIETSERKDEYGGSFENRIRLLTELILQIREKCGEDFIIAVRFGNPDYEELLKTADAIQSAGGDLLDVSSGMGRYLDVPFGFKHDSKVYAASLVKANTKLPVICVGNIYTGDEGEIILKEGLSDMIAVGRGSLADPAWARKTVSGETPDLCLHCKNCLWYIDGTLCPARKRRLSK